MFYRDSCNFTPRKGGCQGSGSLAFIMKKFFKQETVVCLSFCFVCFYGYSIWNRNVQNVLWNWRFLEGFVNKIWTAIQRQTNMFHCTSNTCIRKNSGTYLFDEVTTDEQTTSKLVVQESIVDAILRMWVWIATALRFQHWLHIILRWQLRIFLKDLAEILGIIAETDHFRYRIGGFFWVLQ